MTKSKIVQIAIADVMPVFTGVKAGDTGELVDEGVVEIVLAGTDAPSSVPVVQDIVPFDVLVELLESV